MKIDPRIDAYILASAEFARPVLEHFRELVHAECPDVEETIKWKFPHFDYKGMFCSMAAFKSHCAINFWKGALFSDPAGALKGMDEEGMGNFGKIGSLADLPADGVIRHFLRQGMELNEQGQSLPNAGRRRGVPPAVVPEFFQKVLEANPQALRGFEAFSPSARREYIEWISESKTQSTREKRLATALQWIAEGKRRNWQYQKK